ncbi:MAG TPA: hypothetical protein VLM43_14275 [Desulfobacterales bacterium]|nr:hypothetical protein [Desulfobacterales bacterium]
MKKQDKNKEETGLRQLKLKLEYNTEEDNIVRDFYSHCLGVSVRYDRAVGYFRANIYRNSAKFNP